MEVRGTDDQLLRIERATLESASTPRDDDLLLNVTVAVAGYSAADQAWVVAGDWRAFVTSLQRLEASRQGQATVQGASPEDLGLTFRAIGHAGHLAVTGYLGWRTPDGFHQKFEFGFPVEGEMFRTILREVRRLGDAAT